MKQVPELERKQQLQVYENKVLKKKIFLLRMAE
jgi:hypothetical protein